MWLPPTSVEHLSNAHKPALKRARTPNGFAKKLERRAAIMRTVLRYGLSRCVYIDV